eukprot:CAMPEP_0174250708 /NCGR_PEP_ID=MMETSP0439-20130205/795_1 /TAXON_ID=0 /ORGANISM="Stereomyxa ramosa, Strain Chinc5" /LENGTH=619 /DNA_ID=CAMNT_0015330847 /DNA_START=27 /DNA_END=1882 /DNA_ORIENTATION=+
MRVEVVVVLMCALVVCVAPVSLIPRACSTPSTSGYPFCNVSLPLDTRIRDLISRINPDEKAGLLTARYSPKGNISRIGLPAYDWGVNCIHGVQTNCGTKCPTSFPGPNALGASFNMSLVKQMGHIIGVELRSLWLQGVKEKDGGPVSGLDCWSPNININRDPRWGRNMEVPGEDPYLNGRYGVAYTEGLQNGDDPRYLQVAVTLKHWDAYSLEKYGNETRHTFNAVCSDYDLHNTYFPAWKASVEIGNAKGVMCSYNALNGVPTCASKFLNQVLRESWGFDGYMTSDSGAVADIYKTHHYVKTGAEASAAAITGGTDINSGNVYLDHLMEAVQDGLLTEEQVDLALYRTLKIRFILGLFDPIDDQPYWHVPPSVVNTPESQEFNLFATRQSLVMLKNEDKTLPFSVGKNVAVVGPHANATEDMIGNYFGQICMSSRSDFSCVVSPFLAIQKSNSGGKTVYAQGCEVDSNSTSGFQEAITAAKDADYVVMILGTNTSVEREGFDRTSITLPGVQAEFSKQILELGKPTVVVLMNGGMLAVEYEKENSPAIIEAGFPGYQGGQALADVIFGNYNPGGKLPYTIYQADYVNQVDMLSMDMTKAPGRSYRYFTGTPLFPFGFG